jgi:hypothetical protein
MEKLQHSTRFRKRKILIKNILGFSEQVDDVMENYKSGILLVLIKFFIMVTSLIVVIVCFLTARYFQGSIFIVIFLSSILTFLGGVQRYKLNKMLVLIKQKNEESNINSNN